MNNHTNIIKLLIENNGNPNNIDSTGISIFHEAAQKGHLEVFNLFSELNISLPLSTSSIYRDMIGLTPFLYSVIEGKYDVCKYLISLREGSINEKDGNLFYFFY